jgi:hypothetical protein
VVFFWRILDETEGRRRGWPERLDVSIQPHQPTSSQPKKAILQQNGHWVARRHHQCQEVILCFLFACPALIVYFCLLTFTVFNLSQSSPFVAVAVVTEVIDISLSLLFLLIVL